MDISLNDVEQTRVARPNRGRPRDPDIETRILHAALVVYGQTGWQGFNIEGVVRIAKVSKDAMYRRWKTRESLLEAALYQGLDWVVTIDTGNVRDDLIALAKHMVEVFSGPYGEVALQLRADASRFSDVRKFVEPYRETMVSQCGGMVGRALERGELPCETKPALIMNLLAGGIIHHIVSTPPALREGLAADPNAFIILMVDVVLQGTRQVLRQDSE